MLLIPELKVFDENLFAFFFTNKNPNKALQSGSIMPKMTTKFPLVTKPEASPGGENVSFIANKAVLNKLGQKNDLLNSNFWNTKSSLNPWNTQQNASASSA